MAQTAEQILAETKKKGTPKEKRRILAEAKKGIAKERKFELAKLKAQERLFKARAKSLSKLRKKPKRLVGTKQPGVKGISKLAQAFLPPGTLEGRPQVIGRSQAGVDSDRGRGRPTGTFKARYLPGVGVVRMPTAVFKRALSAQKAKIRLEEAKRQAGMRRAVESRQIASQQAEQIAANDLSARTQPDTFAESDDPLHMQRVAEAEEQARVEQARQQFQSQQPRGSTSRRVLGSLARGAGNMFQALNRPLGGARQQQQYDEFGRPLEQSPMQQQQRFAPQQQAIRQEPRVTVRGKDNILNQPNVFNNPGGGMIGFRGR